MTIGDYVRAACFGAEIRQAPPVQLPELILEMRRAGNALDTLLRSSGENGRIEWTELSVAVADLRKAEKKLAEAYGY